MFEPVLNHVHQRGADLARRLEPSGMVAIAPDGSPPAEDAVDSLGHAHRESLASADEAVRPVGFDQKVHVIGLHAEMQQPETRMRRRGKRGPDGIENPSSP
jgi:hypothetical protein